MAAQIGDCGEDLLRAARDQIEIRIGPRQLRDAQAALPQAEGGAFAVHEQGKARRAPDERCAGIALLSGLCHLYAAAQEAGLRPLGDVETVDTVESRAAREPQRHHALSQSLKPRLDQQRLALAAREELESLCRLIEDHTDLAVAQYDPVPMP